MKTVNISLNSIDRVKSFVNDISKFDSDFDLVSGRYVIDAKSIMGIFSLDLSKPISLNIHAEGSNLDSVTEALAPYIMNNNLQFRRDEIYTSLFSEVFFHPFFCCKSFYSAMMISTDSIASFIRSSIFSASFSSDFLI